MTHFAFSAAGEAIVDLSGEDLTGVDFGRSDFSGAVLTGTVMKNASFKAAMFRETLLDGATIEGATLDDTRFIEPSMRDTTLKGVKGGRCVFSYCDLRTVKHGDSSLALTSTAAAPLHFSYSTLNYALVGPVWRHMRFDWASIKNVPDEAIIDAHKANLTGIALAGVTFGTSSEFDHAAAGLVPRRAHGCRHRTRFRPDRFWRRRPARPRFHGFPLQPHELLRRTHG